jgi:hypothetical protein
MIAYAADVDSAAEDQLRLLATWIATERTGPVDQSRTRNA